MLVREHINEEFKEHSDPIRDMNIGVHNYILNMCKQIMKININQEGELQISEIFIGSNTILIVTNKPDGWLDKYMEQYFYNIFKEVGIDQFLEEQILTHTVYTWDIYWGIRFKDDYSSIFTKEIKVTQKNYDNLGEHLYEAFKEKSDPVSDMGIGVGYTYPTLKPGAIIRPKETFRIGRESGKIHYRGSLFTPNTFFLINYVSKMYQTEDIYISGRKFSSLKEAELYRKNMIEEQLFKRHLIDHNLSKIKILITESQFNRRFEIIERGI